jgi:hypothetical protein
MNLWRNDSTECDGISNDKMYLHIAVCNKLLFNFSMSSTYLTISDSVGQDRKGDEELDGKGKTSYKLQVDVGHRHYCWE